MINQFFDKTIPSNFSVLYMNISTRYSENKIKMITNFTLFMLSLKKKNVIKFKRKKIAEENLKENKWCQENKSE